MQGYKDLIVWQKSIEYVESIYEVCSLLPDYEKYALCSQMRRAVVSIPANIAEGYSRKSRKEYIQFLAISNGSLAETETYLVICQRLRYIKDEQYSALEAKKEEIRKMLYTLIKKYSQL